MSSRAKAVCNFSCAPGYEKDSLDSSRCRKSVRDQSSCQCDPVGSVNENCDPITGQCVCKVRTKTAFSRPSCRLVEILIVVYGDTMQFTNVLCSH